MGSASKIVLVGATSLIVGVYAVSLKNVQSNRLMAAYTDVSRVQDRYTVDAALRGALSSFQSYNGIYEVWGTKTLLGGGTYYYDVKPTYSGSDYADVWMYIYQANDTTYVRAKAKNVVDLGTGISYGVRKIHKGGYNPYPYAWSPTTAWQIYSQYAVRISQNPKYLYLGSKNTF